MKKITIIPAENSLESKGKLKVAADNPIRAIDEYIETLDFKEMGFTKTNEHRLGALGYHSSTPKKKI